MTNPATQVAVITGAANGLGKALAFALHRRGYHLALIDIDRAGLELLLTALPPAAAVVSLHPTDVAQEAEVAQACADILRRHGRVDLLINNAGISISHPFAGLPAADFQRLMAVNFWGTVHCTRAFLPALLERPSSHLINIISGFAVSGFPGKTAYGASKGAILAFSNALQIELQGSSLRLSVVIPPPMPTAIVRRGLHHSAAGQAREDLFLQNRGWAPERVAERLLRQALAGRYRIVIGRLMWGMDLAARIFPSLTQRLLGRYKDRLDFKQVLL